MEADIPEGLARTKEELIQKLAEAMPSFYIDTEDGRRIYITHEDGCRLGLGEIFYKNGAAFIIGEVFYSHSLILKPPSGDSPEGSQEKKILPFIIYCVYNDGQLRDRVIAVYEKPFEVLVGDIPVIIEAKSKFAGAMKTFMSSKAAILFVRGQCEAPGWSEVYSEVKAAIKRFVNLDFDSRLYDVVACWVLATYFQEALNVLPFLYAYGASGTGKTRLLFTAVYLARHGFMATDPSEASIFRTAEAFKPTLGIDESLIGAAAWKLIRTAFKKGLYVPRVEQTKRKEFVLSLFETFMPVAFSSTEMPKELGGCDADEARAIFIFMKQMPDPIGRDPEPEDFKEVRDRLYLIRLGRANEALKALQEVSALQLPFGGHEREVWLPLLTMAKLVGKDVFHNVLSYAVDFYGVKAQLQNVQERTVVRALLLLYRAKYAEALLIDRKAYIPCLEFRASTLKEYVKQSLEETEQLEPALFDKVWSNEKIGRILTKLGIFKTVKKGRTYYTITAKTLQTLYKTFCIIPGGLKRVEEVGEVGVKKEAIPLKETPTQLSLHASSADSACGVGVPQENKASKITPTSPTSPTLNGEKSAPPIGFNNGKITFEINPPNPPATPTGGLAGGLSEGKTTFVFNPPNPPNPPTIDGLAVVALRRVTRSLLPTEKCCLCGSQGVDYQADLTDGSWRLLCYECGNRLLNPTNPLGLLDVVQKVRLAFRGGSPEEFLNVCAGLGLSRKEADSLLKILLKDGCLAPSPDGGLEWVK